MEHNYIRLHAEETYAHELSALLLEDKREKPAHWKLSPWAVLHYILGGKTQSGIEISPKYIGDRKLIEMAIASLLSDRALLLLGVPGTAKSWLAEHLSAAICGHSNLLVQGSSGTNEDALRYGWNYAELISKGPSQQALVPGPVMRAMESGQLVRIEELTRIPTEIQDALISILSEKLIPIPELGIEVKARQGFNVLASANDMDKGIYPLSSALQRRFNTLVMPLPDNLEDEMRIVYQRVSQMEKSLNIDLEKLKQIHTEKLLVMFRELRSGITQDGKQKIKASKSAFSPAETISMLHHARIQHHYFSDQEFGPADMIQSMLQTFIKNDPDEKLTFIEYNETVLKKRPAYKEWYESIKQSLKNN
ncbi:MAG: AAA family ATPase [Saprospiraceae bacterium]|nr:AAA family ATPase [Saprospiraceae bacterium]